ncbi:RagB/SusD family nutrient uptake outer membrane protein [Pedobacter paludis]|uniref:RagB/SusD family nutrient uptake outer membrane protein n=1 Tax=Pedobacter paludis TaxID=2203212 RepID=A0A317F575_9SPHI|nr:RagB/SusD family nutrient uptake outer membrane protein [Pedobacter paludis]PWS32648.1 hypothetical protein DF947_06135 [Pedobacter paludis]
MFNNILTKKQALQELNRLSIKYLLLVILIIMSGCRKLVEVPPSQNNINSENIFNVDGTAIGMVNNIIRGANEFNNGASFLYLGLLSDEVNIYNQSLNVSMLAYYQNALRETSSELPWSDFYLAIYKTNSAVEGLNKTSSLTPAVKKQLLGEAKFLRAYFYYYAVNLFGDVPLALTTDPEVNRQLPRAPIQDVYNQIVADLIDAQTLLSKNFLGKNLMITTSDRVRPTYWAATALLSRVYLQKGDFSGAVQQSTQIIENTNLFSLINLNDVFLKNSSETIWSIEPRQGPPFNVNQSLYFVLNAGGPDNSKNYYLNNDLYNAFEAGDGRKVNWTGSVSVGTKFYPYAYKYKSTPSQTTFTEYDVLFRLGEQYLIRAEAKARLLDVEGAILDLNKIRTRARLAATPAVPNPLPNLQLPLSRTQLNAAIEQERKVELFTEGFRWFDLKRMPGLIDASKVRADEVMPDVTTAKGGTWNPNWKLLPIPREQRFGDPNMTNAQNPGY